MIGNITKGSNFKPLLKYLLEKEKAQLLSSNMAGENYLELAAEFNLSTQLRTDVDRPVYHVSLSLDPNEELSDRQWNEVARKYLKEMGFENSQFVAVKHSDRNHSHLHIVTSKIDLKGNVINTEYDYFRSQKVIRFIERDYNLRQVPNSWEIDRSQQTQQEIQFLKISRQPSVRRTLQETLDRVSQKNFNMVELVENLSNEGIKVQTHQRDDRLGISYQLNGIRFPGYELGKAYSFPGLQKYRGITFDRAMIPEVVKAAALSQANPTTTIVKDRSLELDREVSKPSSNKLEVTPNNPASADLELNRASTEPISNITFDRLIQFSSQLERKKKQIAQKQQMKESQPKHDHTKNKDQFAQLNKELADVIGNETGIFETPIGKAVINCLKLNQSRQKLEQLDRGQESEVRSQESGVSGTKLVQQSSTIDTNNKPISTSLTNENNSQPGKLLTPDSKLLTSKDRHPMEDKIAEWDKQRAQQKEEPIEPYYGDRVFKTGLELIKKFGKQKKPNLITAKLDERYLITRAERSKPNYPIDPQLSLKQGQDCSNLTIFDIERNRPLLSVNFRESQSQRYISTIDLNDRQKKYFSRVASRLEQVAAEEKLAAIKRQQEFEDSPRYGHGLEVARDLDRYLDFKGIRQHDKGVHLYKDGFEIQRQQENDLSVTKNNGEIVFEVNSGRITKYEREKLEDNLYKSIKSELIANNVELEPVSLEQGHRNQIRDYLASTMRSYGMRDYHQNISYFENENLRMEQSYVHPFGQGFHYKLKVFDRQDNDRLMLEYGSIEVSGTIKSPQWLLEKEDLTSKNIKDIGKLGRETERLNDISNFRDYARELILQFGERESGRPFFEGKYQNNDYEIEATSSRLVVRDRHNNRELLNCSNDPTDIHSELTAIANFKPIDLEFFTEQYQKIQDFQRQRQHQQRLSRQRQLDRDHGLDLDL